MEGKKYWKISSVDDTLLPYEASTLLVKNNYLEILMLAQMEVTMKTIE